MSRLFRPSDFIGKTFNYLTVIEFKGHNKKGSTIVSAKCKCGSIRDYILYEIKRNNSKSCGCTKYKHGLTEHPIHGVWKGIRDRCLNKNFSFYKDYGGRGIIICDEWLNNFKSFYDWCIVNGWQKGLEIDRKNNDGNYEPDNCQFVSRKINANNRRDSRLIEHNGKIKTLSQWAETLNINYHSLHNRLDRLKWPVNKAFTTPTRPYPV